MSKANEISVINNVKISIFDPVIDKERIDEKYDFYRIETTDKRKKYLENGRAILALPVLKGNIQSVTYEGGEVYGSRALFVMTLKSNTSAPTVRLAVHGAGFDDVSVKQVIAKQAGTDKAFKEIDLFRLLLNASFNSDIMPFNNFAEHLWILKKTETRKKEVSKIISLAVMVKNDYSFSLNVQTFSGKVLDKYIRYPAGRNWDNMPKYVYHKASMQMLPDIEARDNEPRFIKKSCGTKSELKFLGFANSDEFANAKIGTLCDLEETFNRKYEGMARLGYRGIPEVTKHVLDSVQSSKKADNTAMFSKIGEVTAIDLVKTDASRRFCSALMKYFWQLGISYSQTSKPKKGANNLVIVHDAEWYKKNGIEDPYYEHNNKFIIQHIAIESIADDIDKINSLTTSRVDNGQSSALLQAILHDFQFKRDIQGNRISAINLSGFARDGVWRFGIRKTVQDEDDQAVKTHFFGILDLAPDNTIKITCQKDIVDITDPLANVLFTDDHAECVIQDDNGNIVTIEDTGLFPIPEIALMRQALEQIEFRKEKGKRGEGIKGKDPILAGTKYEVASPRTDLWGALGDINCFALDDCFYYYVDEPGKSIKQSSKSSTHIRKISGTNAVEIGNRLLQTFRNIEIRNGLPSVLPFACKYIREKMLQEFPELRRK